MHRIALALALALALMAAPSRVHAAPPDPDTPPPPPVTVIAVEQGQVVGTWVTIGDIVFAHYFNRAVGEDIECAWDRRTREVLYGRNLGAIRRGD